MRRSGYRKSCFRRVHFDGKQFGTAVTCLAFKQLAENRGPESSVASARGIAKGWSPDKARDERPGLHVPRESILVPLRREAERPVEHFAERLSTVRHEQGPPRLDLVQHLAFHRGPVCRHLSDRVRLGDGCEQSVAFGLTRGQGSRNNKYFRFSGAARWCNSSRRETRAA